MNVNKRILLGHLASFGDCLYATAVARQIKNDYPGCHLTWAIGSKYSSIIEANPYIDEKWIIPLESLSSLDDIWRTFEKEANSLKQKGYFDEIFLTQFNPSYLYRYDGSIRSAIFKGYPNPINVPVTPIVRLYADEVEKVKNFAQAHSLMNYKNVVLFECAPQSLQSFITPAIASELAHEIVENIPDLCIILSTNITVVSHSEKVIDGSILSFRENAHLTKFCSLLIGSSSGITWLSTSDWAKSLPMLQILNPNSIWFPSVIYDHQIWNLPTENIIEIYTDNLEMIKKCIHIIFCSGFSVAKAEFQKSIQLPFFIYDSILLKYLFYGEINKAKWLICNHIKRHGISLTIKRTIFRTPITLLQKFTKLFYKCLVN